MIMEYVGDTFDFRKDVLRLLKEDCFRCRCRCRFRFRCRCLRCRHFITAIAIDKLLKLSSNLLEFI